MCDAAAIVMPFVLLALSEVAYGFGFVVIVSFNNIFDVYVFLYKIMNSLSLDPGSLLMLMLTIDYSREFFFS